MRLLDPDRLEECAVALTSVASGAPDPAADGGTVAATRARETSRAFDSVADEYHRTNCSNPILSQMRARALGLLRRHVPAGAKLLDLGCGPGTDHPVLVAAGYDVTGIDSSPAMARAARARAAAMTRSRPAIVCRSIDAVEGFGTGSFDAAFSNLGPLNCVDDLAAVARQLHHVIRPAGVVVASVIGRLCPWEIALYASRGDLRRAFLRFRSGPVPVPLNGQTVWTRYYSPRELTSAFDRAGFARIELVSLGLVSPPPYMDAFASRHPRFVSWLQGVDDVAGAWPVLRGMGDHFAIALRRG